MQDIFGIFPLRLVDKNGKVDKQVDKVSRHQETTYVETRS